MSDEDDYEFLDADDAIAFFQKKIKLGIYLSKDEQSYYGDILRANKIINVTDSLSYEDRYTLYDDRYTCEGKITDFCIYCGEKSTVWDHIPPLIVLETTNFNGKCIKVRSCQRCNNILKDLRILSVIGRKNYLKEIYSKQLETLERKLKYLNRLNDWWK
jgi:hypothetical protein